MSEVDVTFWIVEFTIAPPECFWLVVRKSAMIQLLSYVVRPD
jgi:hypothetical protein